MGDRIIIEVPESLKSYLEIEHCDDFNLNRYRLNEQMEKIFLDIKAIYDNHIMEELRKKGVRYLNSLLMHGLPGTGKTTFARFAANQLDMDLIYVNFANMQGGLGESNRIIHDIFRFVANKKCIFLLDEIDCITTKRSTASDNVSRIMQSTTITVMQELDYFKDHAVDTCVMGATNRVDILDNALRSRFAMECEMSRLTNMEKEDYLINYLKDAEVPFSVKEIQQYVSANSGLEQRNMEADMVRGIIRWMLNGKKEFHISHVKSSRSL